MWWHKQSNNLWKRHNRVQHQWDDLQKMMGDYQWEVGAVLQDQEHQEGQQQTDQICKYIEKIIEEKDAIKQQAQRQEFIDKRIASLSKEVKNIPSVIAIFTRKQDDFILPETRVQRHILMPGFYINDPEIYKIFMKYIVQEYPKYKGTGLSGTVFLPVIYTLGEYFGNYYGTQHTEERNRQFYYQQSESIDIAECKGKQLAVCAEKATVAHNLLKIFGIDSHLIISPNCHINSERGAHAYIVFTTPKGKFIFDPTNSVLVEDKDDHVKHIFPAIYKISDQEYQYIMSNDGNQVSIQHYDQIVDGTKYQQKEAQQRKYW